MEASKERLARDTVRDAAQQEVQQVKREDVDFGHLVVVSMAEACWATGAE